jgi:HTH-type transcriptional regulator, sugar sensing transcriptional regulator
MDDFEGIIERLKHLGLNTYEAKVYVALLKHNPATGYEISKNANVPQARAYDTLKALEIQKMVASTGDKPMLYVPVPPEELLSRFEKNYQGSIDFLRGSLPNLTQPEQIEPVYHLNGEKAVFSSACQIINEATETVFLEVFAEDQAQFEPALRSAVKRGVKVHVVGYQGVSYDFCKVHAHPLPTPMEDICGERWIILAVDTAKGMVGSVSSFTKVLQGVLTKNPSIVFVIKEMVVHDIFVLDLEQNLQGPMEAHYGNQKFKLRNAILGQEVMIGAH